MSIVTWNSSDFHADFTLSNGNLTALKDATGYRGGRATTYKSSGKWYWEVTVDVTAYGGGTTMGIGIANSSKSLSAEDKGDVNSYTYRGWNGNKSQSTETSYGSVYDTVSDVIGIALDLDNGKIWWSKNGTWQDSGDPGAGTGEAFSGITGSWTPYFNTYVDNNKCTVNFGASSFSYSVPTDFIAYNYDSIVSEMTSNTTPSPFVVSASSEYTTGETYYAFKEALNNYYLSTSGTTAWLKVDIGASNKKRVAHYAVSIPNVNTDRSPKDWILYGSNNGTDWDTLDTVTGETSWATGERRLFDCDTNTTAYRYFKIDISDVNGGSYVHVGYLQLYGTTDTSSVNLQIDHTKIDSTLTNFPIAIDLGEHTPEIFTDLGANNLKFKIEVDSTECYAEIECWDILGYFNPDDKHDDIELSNDNKTMAHKGSGNAHRVCRGVSSKAASGKWYFEVKIDHQDDNSHCVGIADSSHSLTELVGDDGANVGVGLHTRTGRAYFNGSYNTSGDIGDPGDYVQVAIDFDAGKVWFGVNNVWSNSGDPANGSNANVTWAELETGTYYPAVSQYDNNDHVCTLRMLEDEFDGDVPTGFSAWDEESIGVIHTKIPSISSTQDTEIEISWNSSWSDNTDYVGVTGSIPAQTVWDDNFVAVYNMAQDPSTGGACILDSTSNGFNLTPSSLTSSALVDFGLGKGIEFDGVNDSAVSSNIDLSDLETAHTLSIFCKFATATSGYDFLVALGSGGSGSPQFGGWHNNNHLYSGAAYNDQEISDLSTDVGEEHLFTWRYTSGAVTTIRDITESSTTKTYTVSDLSAQPIEVGGRSGNRGASTTGMIYISDSARSDAWIKATNYSLKDELFIVPVILSIFIPKYVNNFFPLLGGV